MVSEHVSGSTTANSRAVMADADLPSDDEEDDDYVPLADNDAEDGKGSKRKALDGVEQARVSKQAKRINAAWALLRQDTVPPASDVAVDNAARDSAAQSPTAEATLRGKVPRQRVMTHQLCRRVHKKAAQDRSWRSQFGLPASPLLQSYATPATEVPSSEQVEASKAVAAAAVAAAKALATTDQYGRTIVTETRKFAGQNIQMKKAGVGSTESETKAAVSGLDAMLAAIKGAKKVTVLDKSKADWSVHKQEAQLETDLAGHNRSNDRYVDKQDFLARAEVREYEASRDSRLNADVRNRSRA